MHPVRNMGQRLAASFRELGPLRYIAVASAVLPTAGALGLLARLDVVVATFADGWIGAVAATVALAVAVALLLLPPSFAAVAAGYGLGAVVAVPVVVMALAGASWLGRRWVWPLVAGPWFPFMQPRPRVRAVQQRCSGTGRIGAVQVAWVRGGARVPFAVGTLLFTVARTPASCVAVGSGLAAIPLATFAGAVGAVWRQWRGTGAVPAPGVCLQLAVGAALVLGFAVAARQRSAAN